MTTRIMPADHPAVAAAEAERIRTVYAQRGAAGRYEWAQPGHLFLMQELERRLLRALDRNGWLPLGQTRALEIGCGTGHFLRELVKWGADPARVVGIDLLEDRLAIARRLAPAGMRIERRDASDIGFEAGSFDLVLQMTVFTSILSSDIRRQVAAEMCRVLAPGGCIVWYDFRVNNPRNPDTRGIRSAEIRSLFPGAAIELETLTLIPPLTRRLAPHLSGVCSLLSRFPFLRTHYLAIIRPPAAAPAHRRGVSNG
jgi:SAM-dependent methyltransferase